MLYMANAIKLLMVTDSTRTSALVSIYASVVIFLVAN